jgi:hypothetical protein
LTHRRVGWCGRWLHPKAIEAQKAGERFYYSGTPCKRGHTGPRLAINGSCLECRRITEARRRPRYRPKRQAYTKEYNKRPEVIAWRKKRTSEYRARPEVKARRKAQRKGYNQRYRKIRRQKDRAAYRVLQQLLTKEQLDVVLGITDRRGLQPPQPE